MKKIDPIKSFDHNKKIDQNGNFWAKPFVKLADLLNNVAHMEKMD